MIDVRHEQLRFHAAGSRLDGDLWTPRVDAAVPAVVVCSGYQGLKDIHPARFARFFAPRGIAVLGFDYRGFGWSEGERGRLVPQEQVEDVRAALSVLEGDERFDGERIGVLGWALGGGVAVALAADDPRVKAVATINAVADGLRTTRRTHSDASWAALKRKLARDRVERVHLGRARLIPAFEALGLGDGATAAYVGAHLRPVSGFGTDVTLESVDALLRFRPEDLADRIPPRPFVIMHGTANDLYAFTESERLAAAAGRPDALVRLEGAGHTEWMHDDHPLFRAVAERLTTFFSDHEDPGPHA